MKKLLILFLLLTNFLLSQELTLEESSAFGSTSSATKVQEEATKKVFVAKNLYLSYLNYPKHIYKNQRFEIEIKALITRNNFDNIKTRFVNAKNMTPLNANEKWIKSKEAKNTYTNKFYFKAYEKDFIMPKIEVLLYEGETLIETRTLKAVQITFSEIAKGDERFSQIIASNLHVIASKSKQYTNKEALTIVDIEGKDSNLEDFYIQGIKDQGITDIQENYPSQKIIYYFVIPIHKKTIVFNYYNTKNNKFEKISVPIIFEEELVSTQTDLNPNNSSFEYYKKIAMGVIAVLFLILFIWKRKYIFLILFLIFTIVFILFAMPNKTVKLKANSVIYILPTKNSTIFQKVSKQIVVEDMKRKNGFVKIMFGSGTNNYIGWVKEEDVIKN